MAHSLKLLVTMALKLLNHKEANSFEKDLQYRQGLESTRLFVPEAGVHSGYIYMVHAW